MSDFQEVIPKFLTMYDRVMYLKIFVDGDNELKNMYINAANKHNAKFMKTPEIIDAGFDLFAPGNEGEEFDKWGDTLHFLGPYTGSVNKLDFKICCSAEMITSSNKVFNTGFYMYPRSSLSKTRLRLANSVGIIDSGYRGHIMAMFDVLHVPSEIHIEDTDLLDFFGKKYDRYVQICAPGLVPIVVEIVDKKEDLGNKTERGDGGFGSTGR